MSFPVTGSGLWATLGATPARRERTGPSFADRAMAAAPLASDALATAGSMLMARRNPVMAAAMMRNWGQDRRQQLGQQMQQDRQRQLAADLSQALPNGVTSDADVRALSGILARHGRTDLLMPIVQQTMQMQQARQTSAMQAAMRAPTTRKYMLGAQEVTEEWDPATQSWSRVATGTPQSLVSIQGDPLKAGVRDEYQTIADETGDASLARAVVNNRAFSDPISGVYFRGGDLDRRKVQGMHDFAQGMDELEAAAEDVARVYPDLGRGEQASEWLEEMTTGTMSPEVARYDNARRIVSNAYRIATTGAQASERELQQIMRLFPDIAGLTEGGAISPAARARLDTWRRDARNRFVSRAPKSQRGEAEAFWESQYGEQAQPEVAGEPGAAVPPESAGTVAAGTDQQVMDYLREREAMLGRPLTEDEKIMILMELEE